MAMTTIDLVLCSSALGEAARGTCTEPKPEANPAYQSGVPMRTREGRIDSHRWLSI
jgi:hypothetical protein